MATIALSLAASIGLSGANATVGAAVGAAIGAYIDQRWVYPHLFPVKDGDDIKGNRLTDFEYQSANEGSPLNFGIGPKCRSTGTVIFLSQLYEEGLAAATTTGGKGGGGSRPGAVINYRYLVDIAVGFNYGREIFKLNAILADGKRLYADDWDVSVTKPVGIWGSVAYGTGGGPTSGRTQLMFYYNALPEAADFIAGDDFTISGCANASNDGTFPLDSVAVFAGYVILNYTNTSPCVQEDLTTRTIVMSQTIDKFQSSSAESITVYTGEDPQTPNSDLTTYAGAGLNPGYNKTAYVYIKQLVLTDYGNRVPQFTFMYQADEELTVAEAIEILCLKGKLTADQFDVTGVATGDFYGMVLHGPFEPARALQSICATYDIITQYTEGIVVFVSRENLTEVEINPDHLGAGISGAAGSQVTVVERAERKLPTEFEFSYIDIHKDLQGGSEVALMTAGTDQRRERFDSQLSMSSAQARAISNRMGWAELAHRADVSFQLPPSEMALEEGDITPFTVPFRVRDSSDYEVDYRLLVTKKERGENGLLLYTGVPDPESSVEWEWADEEESNSPVNAGFTGPSYLDLIMLDIAALADDDVDETGIYLGASLISNGAAFSGGSILESRDGGTTYEEIIVLERPATAGICLDTLAASSGPGWDLTNTVTVMVYDGTLETSTEAKVLDGANRCMIGGELIGFKTATLVTTFPTIQGGYKYELSDLLRGLNSTDDEIDGHAASEQFVFLNDGGLVFHKLNDRAFEQTRYYKAVGYGWDEDDITGTSKTLALNSNRPWSPCEIAADRDGSNHVTFTYTRRSRAITTIFGTSDVPELEPHEKYEVDVWDDVSHTTLMRTIEIVLDGQTQPSYHYSATDQSTDGYTPGDDLYITMYQVSIATGRRSKGKDATV
jgi:hypothetical protein